uniref:Uncharacterized protein n=1 Tax=Triticum urartu TaxID=4572 RepID=A0A8R7P449_TRIUA
MRAGGRHAPRPLDRAVVLRRTPGGRGGAGSAAPVPSPPDPPCRCLPRGRGRHRRPLFAGQHRAPRRRRRTRLARPLDR